MFKLHVVQAQFGDCLILEFGPKTAPRYVLVDGGPSHNYANDLEPALQNLVRTNKLDLVMLSHIDTDHVVGLLDLLAALEEDQANGRPRRISIAKLWHNSFQKALDRDGQITARMQTIMTTASTARVAMPLAADAFFGVPEGNRLRLLATKLKLPLNKGFKDDLILVETAPKPLKFGKLSLQVVGPNQANLDALRADWMKWLDKAEQRLRSDAATLSDSDKSVPNLSSIVVLATCDKKTVLLTGDARSDHILSGLGQAGCLTNGKLHVDVLKLPHHGSDRNATAQFFKTVTADTYVISANGKYGNPDFETLKWIVESAHDAGRPIELVATNATPSATKLLQSHKPAKFGYRLTVKPTADHCITVGLA